MGFFKKKEKRGNFRNVRRDTSLQVSARGNGKGRDRMHKTGALLLLLAALAGTVWAAASGLGLAGEHLFANNERFTIREIDLSSTGTLSPSHLLEYAQVSVGQNLFAIDLAHISRNLERTPRVRSAEVRRQLPDTLVIRVNERAAIARMAEGAAGFPMAVDRDGFILGPSGGRGLPLITGVTERGLAPGSTVTDTKMLDALQVLDIREQTKLGALLRIQVIDIRHADRLDLALASGARIDLGRDRLQWRLERLAETIATQRELGLEIDYADLTVDRNFPVRTRAPATEARAR